MSKHHIRPAAVTEPNGERPGTVTEMFEQAVTEIETILLGKVPALLRRRYGLSTDERHHAASWLAAATQRVVEEHAREARVEAQHPGPGPRVPTRPARGRA